MLQPRSSSSTAARQRSSRKAVQESPEETVRKLQRIPANKKCADCLTRLPQVVNLTHGTFVCMACSGVHREFNHRVKGVGASSFSAEEVSKLKLPTSGNEAVNSRYMANYEPIRERQRPPEDNSDLQLLRVWIRRKYIDQAWYKSQEEQDSQKEQAAGSAPGSAPTRVAIPPKKKAAAKKVTAPPVPAPTDKVPDLLGFDDSTAAADVNAGGKSSNDDEWDAFGAHRSQQNAAVTPAAPAFDANFDKIQFRSGTDATVQHPQQQLQSQSQGAFHANFGQTQENSMLGMQQQHQKQHQQAQFKADFGSMSNQVAQGLQPPNQSHHQTQSGVSQSAQQQNQLQQQNDMFANFGKMNQQAHHNTQQTATMSQMQGSTTVQPNQQQAVVPLEQPQIHPQQHQLQGQGTGFQAHFEQLSTTQNSFVHQDQMEQQNLVSSHQMQMVNSGQQLHQQQQQDRQQTVKGEQQVHSMQPSTTHNQNQHEIEMSQGAIQGETQLEYDSGEPSDAIATPASNNVMTGDSSKKTAFDAFADLAIGHASADSSEKQVQQSGNYSTQVVPSKFYKGQEALYRSNNSIMKIKIVNVHHDDNLIPYYDIVLPNGNVKQTDDAHLSAPGDQQQNVMTQTAPTSGLMQNGTSNGTPMKQQVWLDQQQHRMFQMMEQLNPDQMLQVQSFVQTLITSSLQLTEQQHQQHFHQTNGPVQSIGNVSHPQPEMFRMAMGSVSGVHGPAPPVAPPPPPPSTDAVQNQPNSSSSSSSALPSPPKQKEGNPFDKF